MTMRLPRPRHGDPHDTTQELRTLAAAVLSEDVQTLARTTDYLRRSYRVVFIGYVAMMIFGVGAIVAAFVKGLTANSVAEAAASIGLAGLTVGIFVAFFVQRPSAALERVLAREDGHVVQLPTAAAAPSVRRSAAAAS